MANAYAALFAIADADRDGVCGRDEGFRFFQRFKVSPEIMEQVMIPGLCEEFSFHAGRSGRRRQAERMMDSHVHNSVKQCA